jgi:NAD(P)-dependent dehydrogenase (short-subunit alcohol dehydrogenase family)
MGRLQNKVAIVSGAGRGLGRGIALALAREGAAICIAELDRDSGRRTAAEIEAFGGRAVAVTTDVRDRAQVDAAVDATRTAYGRIDVLINNAMAWRNQVAFEDTTVEDMALAFESGVMGTFFFMQACLPSLKERGGRVVNVASAAGLTGYAGWASYAAAKEGIRGLTKVAAHEWGAHGITVNVICPAAATEGFESWGAAHPELRDAMVSQIPLGRIGDPETDIGRVVVFLASEESVYVTGMTMMVDGGQTILH